MKRLLIASLFCSIGAGPLAAQEDDATNLDIYAEEVGADAIPLLASVETAAAEAFALFDAGNCQEAVPLLNAVADDANRVSNLLRQSLEPFYDARTDDQDRFSRQNRDDIAALAAAEDRANLLLRLRNRAWVSEAECLMTEGDRDAAAIAAFRALNLIDIDETDTWRRARVLLWSILEFKP